MLLAPRAGRHRLLGRHQARRRAGGQPRLRAPSPPSSAARSSRPPTRRRWRSLRLTILNMDPPKHNRYRRLVSKGFTPRMITQARRGDRAPGRGRRRRRVREGRGRVRRGDRRPGPGADDLRDDRPREGGLAPHVRALEPAHRLPRRPRLPGARRAARGGRDGGLHALRRGGRRPPRQPARRHHDGARAGRDRRRAARRRRAQPVLHHARSSPATRRPGTSSTTRCSP